MIREHDAPYCLLLMQAPFSSGFLHFDDASRLVNHQQFNDISLTTTKSHGK